uniref:Uncharacterized protein n=1 Tax=Pyricularia oryzae (strain P131) TaxID=1143193 RepID=L7IPJ7_PYRO1
MTRSFWVLLPDTLESWVENTATLRHASEVNSLRLKDAANKGYRVVPKIVPVGGGQCTLPTRVNLQQAAEAMEALGVWNAWASPIVPPDCRDAKIAARKRIPITPR